mmetsp:Transcript_914/g.1984  ORF Transcript_914/g.1984 Transcript_914/m.1984 type:complete len:415 (+) Transcript_914:268-1512(+)
MSEEGETIHNKPHDEEVLVSDEESVPGGESEDGADRARGGKSGDDEDFEFGEEFSSRDDGSPGKAKSRPVQNQPFDEAVELSESESVEEAPKPAKEPAPVGAQASQESQDSESGDDTSSAEEDDGEEAPATKPSASGPAKPQAAPRGDADIAKMDGGDDEDGSGSNTSSDEEDDDEEGEAGGDKTQGYNPNDYANLQVSAEIKELFQYIQRYKPHTVEIETKLKPFIPDYIPAIGEIDHFLKIPRADGKKDNLGLTVLDEPASQQTDPTVLDLQLRAISTQATLQPTVVKTIEHASQNPQKITTWIQSISDLHKSNPPPNVIYSKPMPDIEQLMLRWPDEMEEVLEYCELPSAELDVDTKAYARIVCALLDIPVHNTALKESLHLLFTLYSEFKASEINAAGGMYEGGDFGMMP